MFKFRYTCIHCYTWSGLINWIIRVLRSIITDTLEGKKNIEILIEEENKRMHTVRLFERLKKYFCTKLKRFVFNNNLFKKRLI